jgi:hypothetical protein
VSTTISIIALIVALGGTGYAAVTLPRNSVGTPQIKNKAVTSAKLANNGVTAAKIKKSSVTGAKIADNAIDGSKIRNQSITAADILMSSLGTVPSAASAGTAGVADTAEKTAGVTVIPLIRLFPTAGATIAAARGAVGETVLFSKGAVSVTGRCLRDSGGVVQAEIYARTTQDGAILASPVDSLEGEGGANFLNAGTADTVRTMEVVSSVNPNTAHFNPNNDNDFALIGPDGTALRGMTFAAAKSGTLAPSQGVYGAGDTCLFGGFVMG